MLGCEPMPSATETCCATHCVEGVSDILQIQGKQYIWYGRDSDNNFVIGKSLY